VIVVRVPASSANLGPGFDALGMALTLSAEIVADGDAGDHGDRAPVEATHPADVAFRLGGGTGELRVRSPIPPGRGLGFSGAMRVGGLLAAAHQRLAGADDGGRVDRREVLALAVELEGHADNAAASLLGGLVATSGGRAVPVPMALHPAVVLWIPRAGTSTQRSRGALPSTVAFADASFNVGRTALLVAALVTGDVESLRTATEDRLHQDRRLAATAPSRRALSTGLDVGAWCGWLSGSGPTVALLCDPDQADDLAAAVLSAVGAGRTMIQSVDVAGATVAVQ
jgi:homoserine kinase